MQLPRTPRRTPRHRTNHPRQPNRNTTPQQQRQNRNPLPVAQLDPIIEAILANLTTAEKQLARDYLTDMLNPPRADTRRPTFKQPPERAQ